MNINWLVRFKNKAFWVALIPAVLLLATQVAGIFGYTIDLGTLSEQLIAVVGTVFAILSILGIVVDPTTSGVSDSEQALSYDTPKADQKS